MGYKLINIEKFKFEFFNIKKNIIDYHWNIMYSDNESSYIEIMQPAPNGWVIYIAAILGYIIAKIVFNAPVP